MTPSQIKAAAERYFGSDESPLDDTWTDEEVWQWWHLLSDDTAAAIRRLGENQ